MRTVSIEEFSKGGPLEAVSPQGGVANVRPKPSFFQRIGQDRQERAGRVDDVLDSSQSPLSKGLQVLGQSAGFIGDIGGEVISAVTPDPIGELALGAAEAVIRTEPVQDAMAAYNRWKAAHPEAAGNLEAVVNIGSLVPAAKGGQMAAKGAANAVESAADATGDAARRGLDAAATATQGIRDTVSLATEGLARIPGRIATNVEEKKALRGRVDELPTEVAKSAAYNGVDIADLRTIYDVTAKMPAEQKSLIRQLGDTARDYSNGVTTRRPEEVVGQPLVQRLQDLETQRRTVGQELGAVADQLGDMLAPDLVPKVLGELQRSIPGLEDLRVKRDGSLDFSNTTLRTSETASDRKAIQSIFADAIKPEAGKAKHLLRQELFEALGGKKRGGVQLTGTQEAAYEAIRRGLSNAHDAKNPQYKALNQKYAKIASPVEGIRRFLRQQNLDDDLLALKAGLIARRLTSNAVSNPEIQMILRQLDEAGDALGKSGVSLATLQEFYNLLDRYYAIAAKTGLQGQVRSGVEGATGVFDAIGRAAGEFVGKTDAVRLRALEDAIEEALTD